MKIPISFDCEVTEDEENWIITLPDFSKWKKAKVTIKDGWVTSRRYRPIQ